VFHHAALSFLKQEPGYPHWLSLRRFVAQSSQIVAKTAIVSDTSERVREQAATTAKPAEQSQSAIGKQRVDELSCNNVNRRAA
jgi:hypothetical protein